MSGKYVIKGGKPLLGTIDVRGSKNAALPILAATILTKKKCRVGNLPLVQDVYQTILMLEKMGSRITWTGPRTVEIINRALDPTRMDSDAVKKMRASILFLGPILARFKKLEKMRYPGGCSIGARAIDVHLRAFEDMGARVVLAKNFFSVYMSGVPRVDQAVVLGEFSVTATENVLAFLSAIAVKSTIKIAASEPHVEDLAKFLSKMGARIKGAGTHTISLIGKKGLAGVTHRVVSDYIEAGTFILAGLACGGNIRIRNVPVSHLDFVLKKLVSSGADLKIFPAKNMVEVKSSFPGAGEGGKRMVIQNIQVLPHPGIPTDLQSAFCVLATQTKGPTLIHEPLYEKRLAPIYELNKMNAKTRIYDPHRAQIWGPRHLRGARVRSRDLRGGAALVIAGLAARGTTVIEGTAHIERGYEDLGGRLRALGANIVKV